MANLNAKEYQRFEDIKHTTDEGMEFWYARELSQVLEYTEWRNFNKVIDKAMLACKNSGFAVSDHFVDINKMVELGSGSQRKIKDYMLSRYACYLIMQNGDPRKEVIALGQTYFAIQTRRQEIADAFNQLDEDNKRLVIRGEVKSWQMLHTGRGSRRRRNTPSSRTQGTWVYMAVCVFQIFTPVKDLPPNRRFWITWAVRNWAQTCSALRRLKRKCAGMIRRVWTRPAQFTTPWEKKCGKRLKKSAAPCRRICLPRKKVYLR